MLTKKQLERLTRIIGDLEALQRDIKDKDKKAYLSEAKSRLMKYESEEYHERVFRGRA